MDGPLSRNVKERSPDLKSEIIHDYISNLQCVVVILIIIGQEPAPGVQRVMENPGAMETVVG